MDTLLQYQVYQTNQYGGPESVVYALGGISLLVEGRNSSSVMNFDPFDNRFYSAFALFTLIGWYLPKKLKPGIRGLKNAA